MFNYLCYLINVFYENYLYEFVISDGYYKIYLLLTYQKHDNKFYTHHDRHSKFFSLLLLSILIWLKLLQLILHSTDFGH